MTDVSVILPTYCERDNLPCAVERLRRAMPEAEIVVVDDDSPDGTVQIAGALGVRLIVRVGERGLASAVLKGVAEAHGDIVVIMDADLSHPPEAIPHLVRAVEHGGADVAIGSRYVSGGATPGWPRKRRLLSRAGALLARGLTSARDPLSGFFCCRKEAFAGVGRVEGFKILLEVLLHARTIAEIPIVFRDRASGASKLSSRQNVEYLRQLCRLYQDQNPPLWRFAKFGMIGASGVFVHLVVLIAFVELLGTPS